MIKKVYHFAVFGCFGTTAEIFFTGTTAFIKGIVEGKVNYMMEGNSYMWMFFIYGFASVLFPMFYNRIARLTIFARLFGYAVTILFIEFVTGFILDKTLGKCPWEYDTGLHILGYVRIDYLPYWMVFGFLLEKLHLLILKLETSDASVQDLS